MALLIIWLVALYLTAVPTVGHSLKKLPHRYWEVSHPDDFAHLCWHGHNF